MRMVQDLITIVELKDSIEYFPQLKYSLQMSNRKQGEGQKKLMRQATEQYQERINRTPYFEDVFEVAVFEVIRVNADLIKIRAIDYLEKIVDVIRLVGYVNDHRILRSIT